MISFTKKGINLIAAEITGMAVSFPPTIRTNQYYQERYNDTYTRLQASSKELIWNSENKQASNPFLQKMMDFRHDPFRGTVERRIMDPTDTISQYEQQAAAKAMAAAGVSSKDIDLVYLAAFPGENAVGGGAQFWLNNLKLDCGAIHIESACSGGSAALLQAAQAIACGTAKCVLVVVSCNYSRLVLEQNPLNWTCGDGAAALVLQPSKDQEIGILGVGMYSTANYDEVLAIKFNSQMPLPPYVELSAKRRAGVTLGEMSSNGLDCCWGQSWRQANIKSSEVNWLAIANPTAWHRDASSELLAVDKQKSVDVYPSFANIGPVSWLAAFHRLLCQGKAQAGSLVWIFSVASLSTCIGLVLRQGFTKVDPSLE